MPSKINNRSQSKKLWPVGLILLAVIIGALLYVYRHSLNPASSNPVTVVQGTPSKPTPHPSTINSQSTGGGGVVDKNGAVSSGSSLPPSSEWASSSNGVIVLQQPTSSSTIKSGDTISGLAKVGTVQFLLKDDSVGLIAQGSLKVVNGRFSGILQFTPKAKTGKLEVYTPNPANGAEEDVIDINVNFNT